MICNGYILCTIISIVCVFMNEIPLAYWTN